jgi:hypothetical protein
MKPERNPRKKEIRREIGSNPEAQKEKKRKRGRKRATDAEKPGQKEDEVPRPDRRKEERAN